MAHPGCAIVSVLIGRGNGTFAPPCTYDCQSGPWALALGDLNGDQLLDIVTAHYGTNQAAVFLGLGLGAFAPAEYYPAGSEPRSIVITDFDGDRIPDLATENTCLGAGLDSVAVLLGRGDGTFQAPSSFAAGYGLVCLAAGDLNGDQIPDLAVASGYPGLSVLLGNGDGSFAPPDFHELSEGACWVAIGDLDEDDIPDVVLMGEDVVIFMGAGGGTFEAPRYYADPGHFVEIGDLNGDGIPDLATAGGVWVPEGHRAGVHMGLGGGTMGPITWLETGCDVSTLAIGDVSGDGVTDLVTANMHDVNVSALLGLGGGTFNAAPRYAAGDSVAAVTVADFNLDQLPDVAVAQDLSDRLAVLLGQGGGVLGPAQRFDVGDEPQSIVTADFNGDYIPDLAVSNRGSDDVAVLLGLGDGSLTAASFYDVGDEPQSLVCADFNGDLVPDLATVNTGMDNVAVLLGQGDGTLSPAGFFAVGGEPVSLATGDLNGDGLLDLAAVISVSPYRVAILTGEGDGSFSAPSFLPLDDLPTAVAVDDFNGDEIADIAVIGQLRVTPLRRLSTAAILLGLGQGSFAPAVYYPAGMESAGLIVGDFNGDQIPDLALASDHSANVTILVGLGDGSFASGGGYGKGRTAPWTTSGCVAAGDFNGDGVPDLVAGGRHSDSVFMLLGAHTTAGVGTGGCGRMSAAALCVMPSPVGSEATISFSLNQPSRARLDVYDVSGRLIQSLLDRAVTAGVQTVAWRVSGKGEAPVPSGTYFVRLSANGGTTSRRVSVMR